MLAQPLGRQRYQTGVWVRFRVIYWKNVFNGDLSRASAPFLVQYTFLCLRRVTDHSVLEGRWVELIHYWYSWAGSEFQRKATRVSTWPTLIVVWNRVWETANSSANRKMTLVHNRSADDRVALCYFKVWRYIWGMLLNQLWDLVVVTWLTVSKCGDDQTDLRYFLLGNLYPPSIPDLIPWCPAGFATHLHSSDPSVWTVAWCQNTAHCAFWCYETWQFSWRQLFNLLVG